MSQKKKCSTRRRKAEARKFRKSIQKMTQLGIVGAFAGETPFAKTDFRCPDPFAYLLRTP